MTTERVRACPCVIPLPVALERLAHTDTPAPVPDAVRLLCCLVLLSDPCDRRGRRGSLATALTRAGHEVTVADRSPGFAADAVRTAQTVINATPGAGSLERLGALREELWGKVLVDVSTATATVDGPDGLPADLLYPDSGLAEQLQGALSDTRVIKTLNTMLPCLLMTG